VPSVMPTGSTCALAEPWPLPFLLLCWPLLPLLRPLSMLFDASTLALLEGPAPSSLGLEMSATASELMLQLPPAMTSAAALLLSALKESFSTSSRTPYSTGSAGARVAHLGPPMTSGSAVLMECVQRRREGVHQVCGELCAPCDKGMRQKQMQVRLQLGTAMQMCINQHNGPSPCTPVVLEVVAHACIQPHAYQWVLNAP
jgi:hypothetical protein